MRISKINAILPAVLFLFVATILSRAETSDVERRDNALKQINACLRRNEASSRECKKLAQNVQVLVDVYKGGDTSVLPALLHFAYLSVG